MDRGSRMVTLPPHSYLDFGGIVKGVLAEYLSKKYILKAEGIVVNIGGDVGVFGEGSFFSEISIWHPISGESFSVLVKNAVLCTSGTYKRSWNTYHHIIDPISLNSSTSNLISASVIHPEGYLAEAYATASIIWGIEASYAFFKENAIEWYGIGVDGHIYTTVAS